MDPRLELAEAEAWASLAAAAGIPVLRIADAVCIAAPVAPQSLLLNRVTARIRLAPELGLGVLTTETGERRDDGTDVSYRNILRAGFEEAYLHPNLLSPTTDG